MTEMSKDTRLLALTFKCFNYLNDGRISFTHTK